jgi:hypothetical protein
MMSGLVAAIMTLRIATAEERGPDEVGIVTVDLETVHETTFGDTLGNKL